MKQNNPSISGAMVDAAGGKLNVRCKSIVEQDVVIDAIFDKMVVMSTLEEKLKILIKMKKQSKRKASSFI